MDLVPDIELRYSKLRLSLTVPKAERGAASFDTVTTRIFGIPSAIFKRFRSFRRGSNSSENREVRLLDDVSGAIIPGRMTLVLGAPGWQSGLTNRAAYCIVSLSPCAAPRLWQEFILESAHRTSRESTPAERHRSLQWADTR